MVQYRYKGATASTQTPPSQHQASTMVQLKSVFALVLAMSPASVEIYHRKSMTRTEFTAMPHRRIIVHAAPSPTPAQINCCSKRANVPPPTCSRPGACQINDRAKVSPPPTCSRPGACQINDRADHGIGELVDPCVLPCLSCFLLIKFLNDHFAVRSAAMVPLAAPSPVVVTVVAR
jgi:hypothetical protein